MAAKTTRPKQLGKATPLPRSPDEALLERVANPHPDTFYATRFTAPEFTCLCPISGQPDFAHFVIDYAPKAWLIEFEVAQALPWQLSQSGRLPRGRDGRHRQAPG